MKILVVFTGGTIGSTNINGVIAPDSSCSYTLLDMYDKAFGGVSFTAISPYTILSENLCGENLNSLYDCICSQNTAEFDGIIVTHGTDTLQYTSAFLGFAFANSSIPIVVVSANYPLADERSNGLCNFAAAVDFIRTEGIGGVFVSYKNKGEPPKIHRAEKLLEHAAYSDEVQSVFNDFYGEIIDNKFVKNSVYRGDGDLPELKHPIRLSVRSGVLRIVPYVSMIYPKLTEQTKAVLLESYHSGTLNTDSNELAAFCREAEMMNIPVFLTGAEEGFFYESKLKFDRLKIRILPPMAPIAAYMLLWIKFSE